MATKRNRDRHAGRQRAVPEIDLEVGTTWPQPVTVPVEWLPNDERAWRTPTTALWIRAIVPPEIADVRLATPPDTSVLVTDAERALAELDLSMANADPVAAEVAAFALMRSESVSSSRIEGLSISHRGLAEAIYSPANAKRLAREIVNNLRALERAVALGATADPFTEHDLLELHRILMDSVPGIQAGTFRSVQNWIGPSNTPADAVYVPPPPGHVPRLVNDLVRFVNRTDMPAVMQAAIAHAQFEAIHPAVDGNGRVGRCLVSVILRRRNRTNSVPPVSGVLLADMSRYYQSLRTFQQDGDPWPWINHFSEATATACVTTRQLVADIEQLKKSWFERSGNPRRGSVTHRLIGLLPQLSFTDAQQVAERLGVDPNVARRGLNALHEAGVLSQVAGPKRNRAWRADEMHRLLDDYGANFVRDVEAGLEADSSATLR